MQRTPHSRGSSLASKPKVASKYFSVAGFISLHRKVVVNKLLFSFRSGSALSTRFGGATWSQRFEEWIASNMGLNPIWVMNASGACCRLWQKLRASEH